MRKVFGSKISLIIAIVMLLAGSLILLVKYSQENSAKNPLSTQYLQHSARFKAGIYYRQPNVNDPTAVLRSLNDNKLRELKLNPGGFDIMADRIIYANGSELVIENSNGDKKNLTVDGLYSIAYPSFSPDGRKVVVQASTSPQTPTKNLAIYTVDLANGQSQRISPSDVQAQGPKWFHQHNKIAFSTFNDKNQTNLVIYNLDQNRVDKTINDAGGLDLTISTDDKWLVSFAHHQIYSLTTYKSVADLSGKTITSGLTAAGYTPDRRFNGPLSQYNYILAGSFSPDGKYLAIAGAVRRGNDYGEIIYQVNNSGNDFKVISDLTKTNPQFSGGNNFFPT